MGTMTGNRLRAFWQLEWTHFDVAVNAFQLGLVKRVLRCSQYAPHLLHLAREHIQRLHAQLRAVAECLHNNVARNEDKIGRINYLSRDAEAVTRHDRWQTDQLTGASNLSACALVAMLGYKCNVAAADEVDAGCWLVLLEEPLTATSNECGAEPLQECAQISCW